MTMKLLESTVAVQTFPERASIAPPPARTVIQIAANLRARNHKGEGGTALLIAPVSKRPAGTIVYELGRAFAHLGESPVLIFRLGMNPSVAVPGDRVSDFDFTSDVDSNDDFVLVPVRGASLNGSLNSREEGEGGLMVAKLGIPHHDPIAMIASARFANFLSALKKRFRYILVEGSPLPTSPESVVLAQNCDGVVLTVQAGVSATGDIQQAQLTLARFNARALGFVFEAA